MQTRLQRWAIELGDEGVDGFSRPAHPAALRAFQQQRGLLVDGVVGDNTWRELVEAGYALGDRLLYLRVPNLRGDDVLALQVKLNLLGFNAGPERGIFDEARGARRDRLPAQRRPAGRTGSSATSTLASSTRCARPRPGARARRSPIEKRASSSARSLAGQVVVVDPGHGGTDTGLVGAQRPD